MQIFGHRGVPAERLENTLPSFERALELGCDGIELDVWLSRDGIPAVIHDDTVDRTTDGTGRIVEFTMHQLRELTAGGSYVPSLGEVLSLVGERAVINVELKDSHAVTAAIDEVSEHPSARVFYSAEDEASLRAVRTYDPDAQLYPLSYPDRLDHALALAQDIGVTGISVSHEGLTRDHVKQIHARGLVVWVWTVNDAALASTLRDWGVDAVCTDDPSALRQTLRAVHGSTGD